MDSVSLCTWVFHWLSRIVLVYAFHQVHQECIFLPFILKIRTILSVKYLIVFHMNIYNHGPIYYIMHMCSYEGRTKIFFPTCL